MARFLSAALAVASFAALAALAPFACSSASLQIAPGADDAGSDTSVIDDVGNDTAIDDTGNPDSGPTCASPPCCTAPKSLRCGTTCVDPKTDLDHCGSCLDKCSSIPHGSPTCTGGSCTTTCTDNFHLCSSVCSGNKSTLTCGTSCSPCPDVANATTTCDGTKCGFTCFPGFADCDATAPGCETDLGKPAHCGGCTTSCTTVAPNCSKNTDGSYACTSGCSGATSTNCGGSCVDTTTDPTHCGSCDGACVGPTHGRPTCTASKCTFVCDSLFHACGTSCLSDSSVSSCGSSCTACVAPAHSTSTCDSTKGCGYTCVSGYADCNGKADDGCEADLTNPKTCGGCTTSCPVPTDGVASCSGGLCGVACTDPFLPLASRWCAEYAGISEICAGVGGSSCTIANPFAGKCGCQSGFNSVVVNAMQACGRVNLNLCEAPKYDAGLSDFGGVFVDWPASCPRTCGISNAYSGDCSCPAGAKAISFKVLDNPLECGLVTTGGPGGGGIDGGTVGGPIEVVINLCLGPGKGSTFFGAFGLMDDGTCLTPNPVTSGCTCPAGSTKSGLPVYFSVGVATPAKGAGNIYQCVPG